MVLVLFCGVHDRPQATVQDDIEDAGGSQAPGRGQKPPGLFRDAARRPSDKRICVDRTVFPRGGQVERINRTIKDATVKRFHYERHDQLRTHLADFMAA